MTLIPSEEAARDFVAARCESKDFARLEHFVALLLEETRVQNLVANGTIASMWRRHIADSAQLLDHVSRETKPWVDLGTGAGFPGLVLAMMKPTTPFVLIESRSLRIQWLERMATALGLENCRIIGADVRKVGSLEAGVISARAFAPLPRLIAQSARFSTVTTQWVLPKGRSASQEVGMLPLPLRSMFHVEQSVTDAEAGIVVGVGKVEMPA